MTVAIKHSFAQRARQYLGEKLWLLDLIAPNRQLATAVLLHFRTVAGERPVSLHPLVARSVDSDALAKLKLS